MNWQAWACAVALLGVPQATSPLGDDAAKFDQLLDIAFSRHDVAFVEAAVAEDLVFGILVEPDATVWNKKAFVEAVSVYEGGDRNVDGVHVEPNGDVIQARGRIQIKPPPGGRPENQRSHSGRSDRPPVL
jgi:hypothetical protein